MQINSRIKSIKPSATLSITAKAKQMKSDGEDIIVLAAGEPDFSTPLNVKAAAIEAIKDNFSYYTPVGGITELKNAIVAKFKRENKIDYSANEILVSVGGKHGLYNIFQTILNTGDEVILPSPYWVSYEQQIMMGGGKAVIANLGDQLKITPKVIKQNITGATKAIVLNSPSNPTGMICSEADIRKIADIALDNNLQVISDEVYEHFIYDNEKHFSIASIPEMKDNAITLNSISKTYSMTGWRIGYFGGNAEIVKAATALQSHSTSNPTSIAQKAAVAALNGQQESVKEMRDAFDIRRKFLIQKLNAMDKINCVTPQGAFYVFPDISGTGLDSMSFADKLLNEAKVAVIPGIAFGSDNHIRISYAASMADLENSMERLEDWVTKL